MYHGFGLLAHLMGRMDAAWQIASNAAAAFGHPLGYLFGLRSNALPAYPYGAQMPAQHMGFPGMNANMQSAMHPSYDAFAAHCAVRKPCPHTFHSHHKFQTPITIYHQKTLRHPCFPHQPDSLLLALWMCLWYRQICVYLQQLQPCVVFVFVDHMTIIAVH